MYKKKKKETFHIFLDTRGNLPHILHYAKILLPMKSSYFSTVNMKCLDSCHRFHFAKFLAMLSTNFLIQFENIKSVLDMCSFITSNRQNYIFLLDEAGNSAMVMN